MNIISNIFLYILLLLTSISLFLNVKIDKEISVNLFLVLLVILIGIPQLLLYFDVYFKVRFVIYFLLILYLILIVFFNTRKKISIQNNGGIKTTFLIFFTLLFVIIYNVYNHSLGQNSFDTVHYLSLILENATNTNFSYINYDTGLISQNILPAYDFQSYYYVLSYLYKILGFIQQALSKDYFVILMPQVIWLAYMINIFVHSALALELYSFFKKQYLFLILFYLLFMLGTYEHTTLSFIGNSYRLALISLFLIRVYRVLERNELTWFNSLELMFASSILIAFTSSGLFLSIIILISMFLVLYLKSPIVMIGNISKFLIMLIPSELFALFYLSANNPDNFSRVGLFLFVINILSLSLSFDLFKQVRNFVSSHNKLIITFIYAFIYIISIYLWISGFKPQNGFFDDHSRYDMVWYYFNFTDSKHFIINSIYFGSLIFFLIKSRSYFKYFILFNISLFINPITLPFVYRFMTDVVFYRIFEIVFNPFTVILFLSFILEEIKRGFVRKYVYILFTSVLIVFVILDLNKYDHPSFIPTEDYNALYRMDNTQYEVLSVLNTKIILEEYERPKVISQIEFIRGFVPNIYTPISNHSIRMLNKYVINPETSKLMNIFVNRDFIGQEIFDQKPAYDDTCNLLVSDQIDFVLVDKEQKIYDEFGDVIPLYFKVRDCATNVYENDRYILYQFFWK